MVSKVKKKKKDELREQIAQIIFIPLFFALIAVLGLIK